MKGSEYLLGLCSYSTSSLKIFMDYLKFKDVSYETSEGAILKDINIHINQGDLILITGPSGSGKSTFLRMINHLISPSSGDIIYRNRSIFEYNPVELRRNITMCFQMPHLFGDTVFDNLAYPFHIRKQNVDSELVKRNLKLLNVPEEFLKKDVRNLSGGEKQRIALIRSLMFKPDILLLDEVTSALDEENTLMVEKYITKLNMEGITVLWITHDINQENRMNGRRILIEKGILREVSL